MFSWGWAGWLQLRWGHQEREDNTGPSSPFLGVLSQSQALKGLEKLQRGVRNLEKPRPGLPARPPHLAHCPDQVHAITSRRSCEVQRGHAPIHVGGAGRQWAWADCGDS